MAYTIKSGDNLNLIAKANNTDIATLQKLNPQITDPNKISAGGILNLPSDTQPKQSSQGASLTAPLGSTERTNQLLGSEQFDTKTGQPTQTAGQQITPVVDTATATNALNTANNPSLYTGKNAKSALDVLTETLSSITAPATPSFQQQFQQLNQTQGVDQAQNDVINSKKTLQDLENKIISEQGKIKATPGATTAYIQGQLVKIDNETADAINKARADVQNATDNLNTKNQTVSTIMSLKSTDYQNALNQYNQTYDKAFKIFDAVSTEENKQYTRENAQVKTILDTIKDHPNIYQTPSSEDKSNWNQMELKAGLPMGFIEAMAKSSAQIKVDHWQKGSDGNVYAYGTDPKTGQPVLLKTLPGGGPTGITIAPGTTESEVLQGMLNIYTQTGQIPPMGMGNSALRSQFYAAIGSGGGDIVSQAQSNKAMISGATTALRTQQNQYAANKTSINTLDKQLELANKYSDKVSRADSPFVNKYILWTKGQVKGDSDTAAFNNIVKTASNEFAKILSGASASIAGVTVSSVQDAENLLNTAMSKGQFNEVIGLMKKEAQYRLDSQKETIDNIQKDIQSGFNQTDTNTSDNQLFDNLFNQYGG